MLDVALAWDHNNDAISDSFDAYSIDEYDTLFPDGTELGFE